MLPTTRENAAEACRRMRRRRKKKKGEDSVLSTPFFTFHLHSCCSERSMTSRWMEAGRRTK